MDKQEYKDVLKKYCDNLLVIINKSNEQFEKQLSYISAGALALSFVVIEKVLGDFFDTECKWLLITGWTLLTITLLLNLFSNKKAVDYHYKSYADTNEYLANPETKYKYLEIEKRTKRINVMNTCCLILLSLGLISLIIYTSINIYV